MTLLIRQAKPEDLPRLTELFDEAVEWLGQLGHDQWQYGTEGRKRVIQQIELDITAGTVWVAVVNAHGKNEIVATITLDERADPELWAGCDDNDNALYAHRMIVARSMKGKSIGSALLDWAGRKAEANGKQWLRLDAWARNHDLHRYYRREGFSHLKTTHFSHRGSGALFQRPAQSQRRTAEPLIEFSR